MASAAYRKKVKARRRAAREAGGSGGPSVPDPSRVAPKQYRSALVHLVVCFAACATVSAAGNSIHGTGTVVAGLLNAAYSAKNLVSLARAAREAERARIGCKCKHKNECRHSCKCKRGCKCKYWRKRSLPSYEWFRKAFSRITEDQAMEAYRKSTREDLRALHRARKLRTLTMRAVAFDKHAIRRAARALCLLYGLFNGHVGWHEVYMTAHILVRGERVTIAVVALKRGMGNHEAVSLLIDEIKKYAPHLNMALADKEFAVAQVINELKAAKLKHLVAHPQNKKTDKLIAELERTGKTRIAVRSVMKSRGSRETAEYWLIGTLSRNAKDGKWKPGDDLREKYVFYAASDPDINVVVYAKRWGIETSYRMDESIRAKTASRSCGVRIYFFLFTVAVYNRGVVLNEVHTGPGAHRHRTLLTVVHILLDDACAVRDAGVDLLADPDPGGGGCAATAAAA